MHPYKHAHTHTHRHTHTHTLTIAQECLATFFVVNAQLVLLSLLLLPLHVLFKFVAQSEEATALAVFRICANHFEAIYV